MPDGLCCRYFPCSCCWFTAVIAEFYTLADGFTAVQADFGGWNGRLWFSRLGLCWGSFRGAGFSFRHWCRFGRKGSLLR